MSKISLVRTVFAALFLAVAACDGSPTASSGQGGQFSANLTGAVTTQLAGFATSSGQAGVAWVLQLLTPGGENTITMSAEGSGRPNPGTYAMVDFTTHINAPSSNHFIGAVVLSDNVLSGSGFDVLSGTFTVTQSSATSVAGSFTLTAAHSSDPTNTLSVSGTFTSTNKDL